MYTVGVPKGSYKKSYWGLERTVFRSGDLVEINSDNVGINIFGEFNKLKEKTYRVYWNIGSFII